MDTFENVRKLFGKKADSAFPSVEEAINETPANARKPGRHLYWMIGGFAVLMLGGMGVSLFFSGRDSLERLRRARLESGTLAPGATTATMEQQYELGMREGARRAKALGPNDSGTFPHVDANVKTDEWGNANAPGETEAQKRAESSHTLPTRTNAMAANPSPPAKTSYTNPPQTAKPLHLNFSQFFDESGRLKPVEKAAIGPQVPVPSAGNSLGPALAPVSEPASSGVPVVHPALLNPLEEQPPVREGFYRFIEGNTLECTLRNRVTSNGLIVGPVKAQVSRDYYNESHTRVVIPQGTILLGSVKPVGSGEQERLFLAFHRLVMWDGFTVDLDQFQGLSMAGEEGLRDKVNHHYIQKIGYSIVLAGLAALSETSVGTYGGIGGISMGAQIRSNLGQQTSNQAMQIFSQKLNLLPTFLLRESMDFLVAVTADLWIPDAAHHPAPRNW